MIIIVVFMLLIALTFLWSVYTARASKYLAVSDAVWDRLYAAARQAVKDPTMPREVQGFAVASVLCAGCGCLTAQILRDKIFGGFARDRVRTRSPRDFAKAMTLEQRDLFGRIVTTAIFYDTLRSPFFGVLVRRLVFPWLSSVVNGDARPPVTHGVEEIARSSAKAIKAKPEGRRALALSH